MKHNVVLFVVVTLGLSKNGFTSSNHESLLKLNFDIKDWLFHIFISERLPLNAEDQLEPGPLIKICFAFVIIISLGLC